LVTSMLATKRRDRPIIREVAQMPFMKKRITKFIQDQLKSSEVDTDTIEMN